MRIYVSNFVQLFCYVLHFIQKSPLFQPQKKKDIVPVLTQTAKISLFSKYLLFFYPYGNDPEDSNIRIAPTLPPIEELKVATDLFVTCTKLVTVEKFLSEME